MHPVILSLPLATIRRRRWRFCLRTRDVRTPAQVEEQGGFRGPTAAAWMRLQARERAHASKGSRRVGRGWVKRSRRSERVSLQAKPCDGPRPATAFVTADIAVSPFCGEFTGCHRNVSTLVAFNHNRVVRAWGHSHPQGEVFPFSALDKLGGHSCFVTPKLPS